MSKRTIAFVAAWAAPPPILWAIFGFITLNWNVLAWDGLERFTLVVMSICAGILAANWVSDEVWD